MSVNGFYTNRLHKNLKYFYLKIRRENFILKITMYDSSESWRNYKSFYYVFHMWNIVNIFDLCFMSTITAIHSNFLYKIFSMYFEICCTYFIKSFGVLFDRKNKNSIANKAFAVL